MKLLSGIFLYTGLEDMKAPVGKADYNILPQQTLAFLFRVAARVTSHIITIQLAYLVRAKVVKFAQNEQIHFT